MLDHARPGLVIARGLNAGNNFTCFWPGLELARECNSECDVGFMSGVGSYLLEYTVEIARKRDSENEAFSKPSRKPEPKSSPRGCFGAFSKPSRKPYPKRFPGGRFGAFSKPGRKLAKMVPRKRF